MDTKRVYMGMCKVNVIVCGCLSVSVCICMYILCMHACVYTWSVCVDMIMYYLSYIAPLGVTVMLK